LLAWFSERGRRHLPWRVDRSPYRVLISEFMLQQTQVERVIPAFEAFVARFPSFSALAGASQADVVRAWRGLGYNSRAVRLHKLAHAVDSQYAGTLPRDEAALRALPGVGAYTARAVMAFAFDADAVAADVNVRRIVHRTHFGFEVPPGASERELDALALAALPPGAGFAFNSALMDVGATLCGARSAKCLVCPLRERCAAAPLDPALLAAGTRARAQTGGPQQRLRFEATTRYVRGRVLDALRSLPPGDAVSLLDLEAQLAPLLSAQPAGSVERAVLALERDGLLERASRGLSLRA
jgi:A/G-specific adenine glycosylase